MYTNDVDAMEVIRFETEPYRKHLEQNGDNSPGKRNGGAALHTYFINNNHLDINHQDLRKVLRHNGYHGTALIETEKKLSAVSVAGKTTAAAATGTAAAAAVLHHVQPPSDPIVAAVLHPRQNPRPGRLLLENVNNRPQTMDRGTQANEDAYVEQPITEAPITEAPITEAPSTSNNHPINTDLFRNANITVTNKKLMANSGDNSSVDSLNSADSVKRGSEESVIELAEFHQPMIAKDESDGHPNMGNGDGKHPGAGGNPNGTAKEQPADDDDNRFSCGMECLYFAVQCCECSIM